MSEKPPALLSLHQASEYLNMPPDTVAELLASGDLPGVRLGKEWRILASVLERMLLGEASASSLPSEKVAEVKRSEKASYNDVLVGKVTSDRGEFFMIHGFDSKVRRLKKISTRSIISGLKFGDVIQFEAKNELIFEKSVILISEAGEDCRQILKALENSTSLSSKKRRVFLDPSCLSRRRLSTGSNTLVLRFRKITLSMQFRFAMML